MNNPPPLNALPVPNFSYHQASTYTGGGTYGPQSPGFSGNWQLSAYGGHGSPGLHSYLGLFDGGGNPNTQFNYNMGQFDDSTVTGHGGNTGNTGPNTSPGAAAGPQNYEFGSWTWEQILNEVLNLNIPDRNVIGATNGTNRWTILEHNSSGDNGRLYIYGVTWGGNHQDTLVYLSDWLQTPGNPWDVFLNEPYDALYQAETGKLATYSTALDPDSFAGPIYALQSVENFYADAATSLNTFVNQLTGDQTTFQGQAGGAFAQLIWDVWDQTNQISTTIGAPGATGSYDQLLSDAMVAAETFLNSIWNAYADWSNVMEHSPLGAILRALIIARVVIGTPGAWQTNPDMPPTNTPFGDLSTDGAWVNVEVAAKQLWLNSIAAKLDTQAQGALLNLAGAYYTAQGVLATVTTSPPPPITPSTPNYDMSGANTGGGGNINMPPINMPPINMPAFPNIPPYPDFNIPAYPDVNIPPYPNANIPSAFASTGPSADLGDDDGLYNALNYLGDLGQANLNLGAAGNAGLGALADLDNNGFGGLANLTNDGIGSLGDLTSNGIGSLANLTNDGLGSLANLQDSGLGGLVNTLGGAGSTGTLGDQTLSDLGNALAGSDQTQAALRQALASVPADSPIASDLGQALGSNGTVQSILGDELSSGSPNIAKLQSALADNAATQSELEKALALAPSTGPLHNTLERALGDSRKTGEALKESLASLGPAGEAVRKALTTDGALGSSLHRAMLTGQVPATGVLHDRLTSAIGESGKLRKALDEAAAGGAVPSHAALSRAISDNQALQKDLHQALASGQVPSSGPLHDDLERALTQSTKLGSELHQALAGQGIVAEPGTGVTVGDRALTGGLGGAGEPVIRTAGTTIPGTVAAAGGGRVGAAAGGVAVPGSGSAAAGGLGSAGGTTGVTAVPVSSGRFVTPSADTAQSGDESELPLYPPMAGGMGMGGGYGANGTGQERERTTWLAEDEEVWGAEPHVGGPQVIGRDTDDDDLADYDPDEAPDRVRPGTERRGSRQRGRT